MSRLHIHASSLTKYRHLVDRNLLNYASQLFSFLVDRTKWYLYGGTPTYYRKFALKTSEPQHGLSKLSFHLLPKWPFVKIYAPTVQVTYTEEILGEDWNTIELPALPNDSKEIIYAEVKHKDNPHYSLDVTALMNTMYNQWNGLPMHQIYPMILAAYQLSYVAYDDLVLNVIDNNFDSKAFSTPYDVFALSTNEQQQQDVSDTQGSQGSN